MQYISETLGDPVEKVEITDRHGYFQPVVDNVDTRFGFLVSDRVHWFRHLCLLGLTKIRRRTSMSSRIKK